MTDKNKNNSKLAKWSRRTKRKFDKFKRSLKSWKTFKWYLHFDLYGGCYYYLFAKTRCLRLRHKDGRTLGYSTDTFGTLNNDKFRAKRYTLSKDYDKDYWLASGRTKLDNLFKNSNYSHDDKNFANHLWKTLSKASHGNYAHFNRDDLYYDLYRFTLLDRLKFFKRYRKVRKSWTDYYRKTGTLDY